MKKIILLAIISVLVLTGCGSQATFGDPIVEGEPSPIPTAIVPTKPIYTVQRGTVTYEREFFGRTAPVISQDVFFSQDGRVEAIFVEDDVDVQAGDLLARLDTSVLEEQLRQAQTDLEVAESLLQSVIDQATYSQQRAQLNLDLAQLRLDYAIAQAAVPPTAEDTFTIREREILRDLAQVALDEVTIEIDPELQVAVTRAEQYVKDIEAEIDKAQLIAPLTGRVLSLRLDVGEAVIAYETIGAIADLSELEVQDSLLSDEMSELTEGMPVTIKIRNRPGDVYAGKIVALPAPFGSGDNEMTRIQFDDPAEGATFEVGDRVSIIITIAERTDALWLPLDALREFNGRDFVVVEENGIQQRIDVELGLTGGDRVEIVAGLELDQTVIGP
ncbi:MAG: biotin/lipoyl-binding protein [Anaerolineae bacterium]|nr:biotin/lipoyl-binding protein [Anaerolineae bacterium]